MGIIPSDFEHKLLAKPHIKTWQEIGQWGNIQTLYKRQEVSAEAARRPGGSRINSVLANIEPVNADTGDRIHLPPRPNHQPGFQEYIHALNQGNPKGPRPPGSPRGPLPPGGQNGPRPGGTKIRINFKGCWHCGKDGHSWEVVQNSKNKSDFNKGKTREEWNLPPNFLANASRRRKRTNLPLRKRFINWMEVSVTKVALTMMSGKIRTSTSWGRTCDSPSRPCA